MKRGVKFAALAVVVGALLVSCSTLSVRAPQGMFLSTGDYVPGVQTLGIVQAHKVVFAPLFFVDLNSVHQDLYNTLLQKAQAAGANGLTDVKFSFAVSPVTYLSAAILSGVFDYYIEGVAIKH